MTFPKKQERNKRIVESYNQGTGMPEIAKKENISKQRVHQIYHANK